MRVSQSKRWTRGKLIIALGRARSVTSGVQALNMIVEASDPISFARGKESWPWWAHQLLLGKQLNTFRALASHKAVLKLPVIV